MTAFCLFHSQIFSATAFGVHSATCAHAETHNLCVTVVGHSPYEETVHVKAHGKRKAHTKTVRKQRVAVFFGFHSAGHKPSARSFNVLREDVTSLMKHGTAKHGEWFHMGRRLPGRSHQEVLPGSLSDMTDTNPIFAALERGCAGRQGVQRLGDKTPFRQHRGGGSREGGEGRANRCEHGFLRLRTVQPI